MKKIICLCLALVLSMSVICAVSAEGAVTASLAFDKEVVNVGDVVTVTVMLDEFSDENLFCVDAAIYYNSEVLEYVAEDGVDIASNLESAGMDYLYTKADNDIVRCAIAFPPTTLDLAPAVIQGATAVWSAKFKAIAEGDASIQFAIEGKSPKFEKSLSDGVMVISGSNSDLATVTFKESKLLVGEGKPQILISEFIGADEVVVPVGTTAEEVIAKLPAELSVKLDNGEIGTVKVKWTAGSLISGYDGDTEGEYYFTANITDSGEYVNIRNLFSTVKVTVGEGAPEAETTEIIMVIDSNEPTVNGEVVKIDVPAMILDDRTMTPSRFVAEALGAEVSWDAEARTVTITKGETVVVLTIDSNIATINGEEVTVDVPATIIDDRTLTPARFVAEALGAEVSWDEAERKVTIIL